MFIIVMLGHLMNNYWWIDDSLLLLSDAELVFFSIMSLFAGALMIYGMRDIDFGVTVRRCIIGGTLGVIFWLFIIISLFLKVDDFFYNYADSDYELRYETIQFFFYFINWLLMCITGTALIIFSIKFSMKEE